MKKSITLSILLFSFIVAYSQGFYHKGVYREYCINIPPTYNPSKPVALLIAIHGGGGTGSGMQKFSNFNSISNRDTFIVVYPSGYKKHWNDGRKGNEAQNLNDNLDDVGFIEALIDTVSAHYSIDKKRIYASGPSNGGAMCYRLAFDLSTKIAAIGSVISTLPDLPEYKKPAQAIPVLIMNGTTDPIMPYDGGEVRLVKNGKSRGEVISTQKTFEIFSSYNNCNGTLKTEALPDTDPNDGCTVTKSYYSNCPSSNSVVLYTIKNGGHTWPGGTQYLPKSIIGLVCKDINASEIIWGFLKKQKRP